MTGRHPGDDRQTDSTPWGASRPRMRDVTHARPGHDSRAWHWFARGPTVAADGGEPGEARRAAADAASDDDRAVEDEQLRDVSHEPVHGEGANQVWERGEAADDSSP